MTLAPHLSDARSSEEFLSGECRSTAPRRTLVGGGLCASCHVRQFCLPSGFGPESQQHLEKLVSASRRLKERETLYREGDEFRFLYAIRSGTFKTVVLSPSGDEQVTGFHFAGDLLGLDGLAGGAHATGAVALEDAEFCAISYTQSTAATEGSFELQRVVARRMSREIIRVYNCLTVETVSRTLTALERRGLIRVDRKHLRILDFPALQKAARSDCQTRLT